MSILAPTACSPSCCSCSCSRPRRAAAAGPAAAAATMGVAQVPQELLCSILELVLADDQEQQRRQVAGTQRRRRRRGSRCAADPLSTTRLYPGHDAGIQPNDTPAFPLAPSAAGPWCSSPAARS